jgi:hypothetical protein
MTRILSSTVAAAALAGLVGLSAQTPQQPSEREQRAPKAKTVTVAGCLDQAPAPGSSSDRPSSRDTMTSPGAGHFVLKNAQGGTSTTYMLMPAQGVDLAKHVNHKVEVSGTLTKSMTESSAPSAPPPTSATTPSATSSDREGGGSPMLTVKSVKMISNSCTT